MCTLFVAGPPPDSAPAVTVLSMKLLCVTRKSVKFGLKLYHLELDDMIIMHFQMKVTVVNSVTFVANNPGNRQNGDSASS